MDDIKIPDFDEMFLVAERIGKLVTKKLALETTINVMVAETVKKVSADTQYFVNGKPPSMEYIKNSVMITGCEGEIVPIRMDLVNVIGELDELKMKFQVMQDMISIFQTLSANKRAAIL